MKMEENLRGREQYKEAADELLRAIYALREQRPEDSR